MFVSDNKLISIRQYFKNELENRFEAREIDNLYFLINDVIFERNKIQSNSPEERCTETELLFWNKVIKRLKTSEPIQYILGFQEFYGLKFKVSPAVLIPRPETEELVQLILDENQKNHLNVIDIGTGSGCIPVALKKNRESWNIMAADISETALEIAQTNALENKTNIQFLQLDALSTPWALQPMELDIMVSNPPYIPESDKSKMAKNVLEFEPNLALFVDDESPIIFYEIIAENAFQLLKKGGRIYFEIHEELSQLIVKNLELNHFRNIRVVQDLQGKNRIITAIK